MGAREENARVRAMERSFEPPGGSVPGCEFRQPEPEGEPTPLENLVDGVIVEVEDGGVVVLDRDDGPVGGVLDAMARGVITQMLVERASAPSEEPRYWARVTLEYAHGAAYATGEGPTARAALDRACAEAMKITEGG